MPEQLKDVMNPEGELTKADFAEQIFSRRKFRSLGPAT